jgi:hypothetical protein
MQFYCTYTNGADLLLPSGGGGGRLLRSGVLWKSLCIWLPAPGLLTFFMLPTYMVSATMQFYCTYSNVADLLLPSGGGGQALEVWCTVEILVYLAASTRPLGLLHGCHTGEVPRAHGRA